MVCIAMPQKSLGVTKSKDLTFCSVRTIGLIRPKKLVLLIMIILHLVDNLLLILLLSIPTFVIQILPAGAFNNKA